MTGASRYLSISERKSNLWFRPLAWLKSGLSTTILAVNKKWPELPSQYFQARFLLLAVLRSAMTGVSGFFYEYDTCSQVPLKTSTHLLLTFMADLWVHVWEMFRLELVFWPELKLSGNGYVQSLKDFSVFSSGKPWMTGVSARIIRIVAHHPW